MTPDIAIYILTTALVPFIVWCVHLTWSHQQIKKDVDLLLKMHRNPDAFGFGTGETNRRIIETNDQLKDCIRDNTRAIKSLVHYIKWFSEHGPATGAPPPLLEDGDGD